MNKNINIIIKYIIMFNTKLFSFLLLVPYNLKTIILYNEKEMRYSKRLVAGNDERFNNTNDIDINLLKKIKTHIVNKEILDVLNSDTISTQNKLNIIDFYVKDSNFSTSGNNRIAGIDLTGGNLFNEFTSFDNNNNITEVF
jgi:hypothetical protein